MNTSPTNDFNGMLPEDLKTFILTFLSIPELCTASVVSKDWKQRVYKLEIWVPFAKWNLQMAANQHTLYHVLSSSIFADPSASSWTQTRFHGLHQWLVHF